MSRDLILVAIAMCMWGTGEGIFFYFQPLYMQELGADPLRIGAILGASGVAMTLAHVPAGYLADRFGRRPVLWFSWLLGFVATCIMALATTLPTFVAGLLTYALTLFVISPLNSYVTAARGRLTVGQAIMLTSSAFNLGMIFGPLLGGAIGEQFGLRRIYMVSAAIFLVSTTIILFIRKQPVEELPPHQKRNGFLKNTRFLAYLPVVFLVIFATYLPQPLSPNFLQNERGLSLSVIGGLSSLAGLGVVAINIGVSFLATRVGFLLAQAAVGVFALLLWQGSGTTWYALGYFFMGGYKTTRSLATAQTRSLIHGSSMGLAYGVTETVSSTATILAPLLAGYLYTHNPVWMYSFTVGVILVSIAASARFSPSAAETLPQASSPMP